MVKRLQQWLCGLHGHDEVLHFEKGCMSLLCTSCGHETPGWDVKGAPRDVDHTSQPMRGVPLINERSIA